MASRLWSLPWTLLVRHSTIVPALSRPSWYCAVPGRRLRDERAALLTEKVDFDLPPTAKIPSAGQNQSVTAANDCSPDVGIDWSDIAWLRKHTSLPIVVKGITTVEDALLAASYGVDAIYVSNHGARNLESCVFVCFFGALKFIILVSAPGPAEVLLELRRHAPQIFEQCEIFVDGGIRSGAEVLKAVCLGAKAVGIGRPFMFGLAYGEEGASKVAHLLHEEISVRVTLLLPAV